MNGGDLECYSDNGMQGGEAYENGKEEGIDD